MKKNKKKCILIAFIIGAITLVLIFLCINLFTDKNQGDEGDTYDQNIMVINNTHPIKILVYGDDIYFRPELNYDYIDSITKDVLELDINSYERVVLVVNDLGGNANLSESDYLTIYSFLQKGNLDFYYLGTSKFDELIQYEIWLGEIYEDDMSMVSALFYNNISYFRGVWTEYDENMSKLNEENLGMILVSHIVRCIKSNN